MNKDSNIFKQLKLYNQILEEKGYNVIYIGLYGSQNYNLDDDQSDIDVKAIVLPNLHDIIFRKVTSISIECENGTIDVKDLLTFYEVIKKGNFSYIESIDTKYSIGDKYIKKLFRQFRPNLKSIFGAMKEKQKALTHEYPSKHKEFEKWGFDPKQYHHILRLYDLLAYNVLMKKTASYLKYEGKAKEKLVAIKRNINNLSKEYVEKESDYFIDISKGLIPEDYVYEVRNIDLEINDYIEKHIKMNLLNQSPIMSAREVRTFDNGIPKKDLKKFPELAKYKNEDISYIVYEHLEIL